jgi:ABC-type multidrug transport system fused ATPase/permease subunit
MRNKLCLLALLAIFVAPPTILLAHLLHKVFSVPTNSLSSFFLVVGAAIAACVLMAGVIVFLGWVAGSFKTSQQGKEQRNESYFPLVQLAYNRCGDPNITRLMLDRVSFRAPLELTVQEQRRAQKLMNELRDAFHITFEARNDIRVTEEILRRIYVTAVQQNEIPPKIECDGEWISLNFSEATMHSECALAL